MKKICAALLMILAGLGSVPTWSQTTTPGPSSLGPVLDESQWEAAVAQFENSVLALSEDLGESQARMKALQADIETLEEKISRLREKTKNGSGVIDDFRLKSLLNDLKDKLQKNSDLQHQWDEKQREFEQKAISLVTLYNERIDNDLQSTDLSSKAADLNLTFNELVQLIQKRNQTLGLIKRYQKKTTDENQLPLTSFGGVKPTDREGLLLTLDLIRDRKKALEEQLEKWSIEEDEAKNELKLQGKMRDFLEDIQRMNEDSSFPHSSLKRSDLGDVTGDKERKRLQARLDDLQQEIGRGQATLIQINQFLDKVQHQLNDLGEREGK